MQAMHGMPRRGLQLGRPGYSCRAAMQQHSLQSAERCEAQQSQVCGRQQLASCEYAMCTCLNADPLLHCRVRPAGDDCCRRQLLQRC